MQAINNPLPVFGGFGAGAFGNPNAQPILRGFGGFGNPNGGQAFNVNQLEKLAAHLIKSSYGQYLMRLI